jgi:hypothetical protein
MTSFYVLKHLINPHLLSVGVPAVDARIGIDSGEVVIARVGVPQGSSKQERSFLIAIGHAANIACRLQEQAGTNEIWVGNLIKSRAPQDWQGFFKPVSPKDWTWVSSGTSLPYPAWHFDAVRGTPPFAPPPLPELPASTILTSLIRRP